MANPIQILYSGTATNTPTLGIGGAQSNIALNGPDEKLFYYNGTVTKSFDLTTTGGGGSLITTVNSFNGDSITTDFTLSVAPSNENNTMVYINGVYQQKDQYTVIGTTLSFSVAPITGTLNIEVTSYTGGITPGITTLSGTGAQTVFTLTTAPNTENNTMVFINGVYQNKTQYSVSGTTITFITAPISGTGNIEIMVLQ